MTDKTKPPYNQCEAKGWALGLDISRLKRSDTWAILGEPDQIHGRAYLLLLLAVAWDESPCGSLPKDERILRSKLGIDATTFAALKQDLMRGWEEFSDGRLYHKVMTESVIKMVCWREKEATRKEQYRAKKSKESVIVTRDKHVTNVGLTADIDIDTDTDTDTGIKDIHKPASRQVEICRIAEAAKMYGVNPSHLKLAELSEKHGGYPPDAIWDHAFAIAHDQGGGQFAYSITTAFNAWQKSISMGANKPVARKNTPYAGAGSSNPYEIKPEGVKYVGRGIENFEQLEEVA